MKKSAFQKKHVRFHRISEKDLPFYCPPHGVKKWNMHPKVYLSFDADGNAACPYCGSQYKLQKNKE